MSKDSWPIGGGGSGRIFRVRAHTGICNDCGDGETAYEGNYQEAEAWFRCLGWRKSGGYWRCSPCHDAYKSKAQS